MLPLMRNRHHRLLPALLIAVHLPFASVAQKQGQERIDSLIALLPAMAEDSSKVKMLEEISYSYYSIDPDEGVKYGRGSLELAQKLGWEKGMAQAYNTIGINYGYGKSDYPNALDNYLKALAISERMGNKAQVGSLLNNIGSVYDDQGEDQKALEYYERALAVHRELGNKGNMANNLSNIGVVHTKLKNFEKAIAYKLEALKLKEELGDRWGIATNTNQLARIYGEMGRLDTAVVLFNVALPIYRELGDMEGIAKVFAQLGSANYHLAREHAPLKRSHLERALAYTDSALAIYVEFRQLRSTSDSYRTRSEIKHEIGDDSGALADQKLAETYKDSVFNLEKDKKLVQQAMQYEFDKKEAATQAEQEKKDQRQRVILNSIAGVLAIAVLFLSVLWRQRDRIRMEKKRSDELLLNILPEEVAEELKAKGEAEAVHIDQVTVLFTDFKGFTAMSEHLSPGDLVRDLNECFSAFDRITEKYGIEKIKTIGDAYMAAGGLPTPNTTHATDVIHAALEMRDLIAESKARKVAAGIPYFEIRIGIHTGPVVAGIVGVKKFQYDIWGDTVNTASRMESSGEVGQVNISEATYALVKDVERSELSVVSSRLSGRRTTDNQQPTTKSFAFTPRGKVQAKGKGEMEMYFVRRSTEVA